MWLVGQWVSIHSEHSRCELALAEFTLLCSWTRQLSLTMPHSSKVWVAHIHVRIKRYYLTVRIISTFLDSVCSIFLKDFFFSHTQKEFIDVTEDKSYFQAIQLTVTL